MPNLLFAQPQAVGPIDFSLGLEIDRIATLIDDRGSPDLCNCAPSNGIMEKRNGSERFIAQAISSNPISSLYQAYSSPVSSQVYKTLFAASGDKIIVSTKTPAAWVILSSNNVPFQHYNFVTMNGKVLIAGEDLTENVRQYDLSASTQYALRNAFDVDVSSLGINPRGKYQLVVNNYYILANVQIGRTVNHLTENTTYYSSRLLYSFLNNSSSMTIPRFIDFNQNDGEEITAVGTLTGGSTLVGGDFKTVVDVFKPSSIGELSFTVLDLPSRGGDYVFSLSASGVGVLAPRTFVNAKGFYAFLSKSGIVLWDKREFKIISGKIKPLIDDLIRSGKYRNAVMTYYPKKEWLILSFEHPQRFPKGKNNYILVYDFRTGEWFPYCNWLIDSFALADTAGDTGKLFGGSSVDGLTDVLDVETRQDDSRQERSLDVMDSTFSWSGSSQNVVEVREGTASLKISIFGVPSAGTVFTSSMTRMDIFNLGEWNDKAKVSLNDKLAFKAFAHNVTSITSLRVDFQVNSVTAAFDTNFSSVVISSAMFSGDRTWTEFEIPLSSFPVRPDWTDLSIESVPFYNRFTNYGIRFAVSGVDLSSVSIDDLRLVGAQDNPNRMHRFTKLFDFQSPTFKNFGQVLLLMDKGFDSSFSIDIYNNFGQKSRTEKVAAEIPKEILIFRSSDTPGFSILDSRDFSVKRQTVTVASHWDCLNGVMDEKNIVCGDRQNDRLISFKRSNLSTFTAVYGSFGSGASNFNLIHEISQFPGGYLLSDLMNQRTKVHALNNLGFLKMFGELGNNTSNYHQPTGVAADGSFFYVSDESNNRIVKMDQSTFGIIQVETLNHNTLADSTIVAGDKDLFVSYNRASQEIVDNLDLMLEKRDKGNLGLLSQVVVKPIGISTGSYWTEGSIGLLGKYVIIPFGSDDGNSYYIQKRLQSTLEVVSEYRTGNRFFSATGYSLSFLPITKVIQQDLKVSGRYIQLKFYDDELDNFWRLYNFGPVLTQQPLTY